MQPTFQITVDDIERTERIRDRLLSLRITDEAGQQSDTIELELDDRDGSIQWPRHGVTLRLSLGYQTLTPLGSYIIDEVEHRGPPDTLVIRGKAADMLASIKAPKTRSWDQLTIAALVQTLAVDNQLIAKVAPAFSQRPIDHLDQTHESDLHFLTRLAKQHGAIAKPVNGFLVFVEQGEATSATGQSLVPIQLTPTMMVSHRLTQAERGKYQAVNAHWHNSADAKTHTVTAGNGEPVYVLRHTYANAQEAMQAAMSARKRLTRGSATLSLTLIGHPEIFAEGSIHLSGYRDPLNGEWMIIRVEHQYTSTGWVTHCEAESPNP